MTGVNVAVQVTEDGPLLNLAVGETADLVCVNETEIGLFFASAEEAKAHWDRLNQRSVGSE